jgi:MoxR-like ATPase
VFAGTGVPFAWVPHHDSADADRLVSQARAAFDTSGWRRLPAAERAETLRRISHLVKENADELARLQKECRNGYVDPSLIDYAVKLVAATRALDRSPDKTLKEMAHYVTFGASPRATIHMIEGARALALLRGRDYVLPEDVTDMAPDVMRHRLVLSYEALADGVTADTLITKVMQHVPVPPKPLQTHVDVARAARA